MTTDREAMRMALGALEQTRKGLLQMREEAETYGEAWAAAYVKEWREMLPGSARERFRLLNVMHVKLADVAKGVAQSWDAIAVLRARLAPPEPCAHIWSDATKTLSPQPFCFKCGTLQKEMT